jgi:hypothetical protein
MLKLWPGVLTAAVCLIAWGYGQWRRARGSPVKPRETVWVMLVIFAVSFPALTLPMTLATGGMTPRDRIETVVAAIVVGALPLAAGLCFWGALKLVRLYIVNARNSSRNDSR